MLEISSASAEAELGMDFANIYKESSQYRWVAVVSTFVEDDFVFVISFYSVLYSSAETLWRW